MGVTALVGESALVVSLRSEKISADGSKNIHYTGATASSYVSLVPCCLDESATVNC